RLQPRHRLHGRDGPPRVPVRPLLDVQRPPPLPRGHARRRQPHSVRRDRPPPLAHPPAPAEPHQPRVTRSRRWTPTTRPLPPPHGPVSPSSTAAEASIPRPLPRETVMRRAPSRCAAAVALVLASAPLLPAQSPLPEPGTEEYAATRAEA